MYATNHVSLRKYFSAFGEVLDAEVIFNRDTKKSRGFGFVIFKDYSAVEAVLEAQNQVCGVVTLLVVSFSLEDLFIV